MIENIKKNLRHILKGQGRHTVGGLGYLMVGVIIGSQAPIDPSILTELGAGAAMLYAHLSSAHNKTKKTP